MIKFNVSSNVSLYKITLWNLFSFTHLRFLQSPLWCKLLGPGKHRLHHGQQCWPDPLHQKMNDRSLWNKLLSRSPVDNKYKSLHHLNNQLNIISYNPGYLQPGKYCVYNASQQLLVVDIPHSKNCIHTIHVCYFFDILEFTHFNTALQQNIINRLVVGSDSMHCLLA